MSCDIMNNAGHHVWWWLNIVQVVAWCRQAVASRLRHISQMEECVIFNGNDDKTIFGPLLSTWINSNDSMEK